MPSSESTALASTAVVPAALHLARAARGSARLPVAIMVLVAAALAMFGIVGSMHAGDMVTLALVGIVLPAPAAAYFVAKQRRLERVAITARDGSDVQWTLDGFRVIATRAGATVPALSFILDWQARKLLTSPAPRP
jgi:hypothetical protein